MAVASAAGPPLRRGGRRIGLLYAGLALLLVVGLLPALRPPRPPVPPVAAYAPEANQQLKTPPPEQSSTNGKGQNSNGSAGQPGGGSGVPTPTPAPATPPPGVPTPTPSAGPNDAKAGKAVPKHLDCVGNPPRQIPDTQAPPCISSYDGPAATATYPGVTATQIKVAVPDGQGHEQEWAKYLNDHFEFYGRQIVLQDFGNPEDSDNPEEKMKLKADDIANKKYFASLQTADYGGAESIFYNELARRGVVSISQRPDLRTEADYQRYAPYEWNFLPGIDTDERAMAATACAQFPPGHAPAVYAGPGPRKFGIAYAQYNYGPTPKPDLSALTAGLARCGITVSDADTVGVQYVDKTQASGYQQNGPNAVASAQAAARQLRLDGVTSVLMLTHAAGTEDMMVSADNLGWQPEWIVSYHFYNTEWPLNALPPQDQWSHVAGVDFKNQLVPAQDNQWYAAVEEENPGYNWMYAPGEYIQGEYMWEELLLLASGIQMAGPDLTPASFEKGLQNTVFPNPSSPYHEAVVGFNGDHTWAKDFALQWYSETTPGAWGQQSTWCYVSVRGRWRYTATDEPTGAPLFQAPCIT